MKPEKVEAAVTPGNRQESEAVVFLMQELYVSLSCRASCHLHLFNAANSSEVVDAAAAKGTLKVRGPSHNVPSKQASWTASIQPAPLWRSGIDGRTGFCLPSRPVLTACCCSSNVFVECALQIPGL